MKCFIKVVECGSLSKAAEEMFLTTSSVSRRIAALEKDLNLKLFEKNGSKLILSKAGEVIFEGIKDIDEQIENLIKRARKADGGLDGALRLGIFGNQEVSQGMYKALKEFEKLYPNINLYITADSFEGLEKRLKSGKIDAISTLKYAFDGEKSFLNKTFMHVDTCFAVPKKLLKRIKTDYSFEDIKHIPLLRLKNNHIDEKLVEHLRKCNIVFESGEIFLEDEMEYAVAVERQLGIGFLDVNSRILNSENIVEVRLKELKPVPYAIFWMENNTNPVLKIWTKYMCEVKEW
ncbi:MAG: LysR family transcriptional regulator [Parasporobacterium sp.]|nr:LysR family transcriptional regulator [Parasporobacterium sp.]